MAPLERQADFLSESEHSQISASPELKVADEVAAQHDAPAKRSVSFGSIQIREYNRIVGDHPDVKVGPPMSIGWDFIEHDTKSLDKYEADKPQRFLRRLTSITRKNLLANEFGIPEEEIRAAEKEVQAIMKARERSSKMFKREKTVKSAKKKLRRVMLGESLMRGLAAAAGAMLPMNTHGTGMGGMAVY